MPQTTLNILLEYIWVPIVTGLVLLWHKFTGLGTRTALLELAEKHYRQQRQEERELRDTQRSEIVKKIDNHHKLVMGKLEAVEDRVKNGS